MTNKHRGYLQQDNRASGGGVEEADVWTCSHCQAIILVNKWKQEGGFCHSCDKPICFTCFEKAKVEGCVPWRKKVDSALENRYRMEQNAKILGT